MHFRQSVATPPTDDQLTVALFPFEDRTRTDAEFLAHFGGNGNLPLGGDFGPGDWHSPVHYRAMDATDAAAALYRYHGFIAFGDALA